MTVITTNLIPDIGASGIYTLSVPFNTVLTQNASYKCLAIRQLQDIVASGVDPFQAYYVSAPTPISQDQYTADLANGVCIVSLQASSGAVVYVPSSFIASFPAKGGVPYTNLMMAVDLGAMPDYVDLTFLKQQITDLVQTTVGLTNVLIQTVTVSPTTNLSSADHALAEAARQANITNTVTPEAKVIALTQQLQTANQTIANLEAFIIANQASLPGGGGTTPPPTVTAAFDPIVVPAGITLSNGNLTATSTVAGWQTTRAIAGQSVGKFYAEATINALTDSVGLGFCNASELNSAELGSDTNGIMIFAGATAGIFYNGGVAQNVGSPPIQGQVLGVAIDLVSKLVWFYNPQTQQWNGDVLNNQNPATGLGGLPITPVALPGGVAGPVYLAASLEGVGDAVTLNAGATPFVNPLPSGFASWNTAS